jgi:glycosyltransferase involved in cell wall biosynthesis
MMSKSLTFSVGVPTFNQAEYLEETIESLLEQTRPADEIVISDHFSTDNTPAIIEKYVRKGKLRGVKPPAGSNFGTQCQYTLSCLSSDWVTLFSSDDVAKPQFCEVLMRGAARRKDAVLVRAAWENIDTSGAILNKMYLLSVQKVTLPPQTLLEQKHGPKASLAAFAVKRDILMESGGHPLTIESFGDWALYMQLAPYGAFIYENEIIAKYRIHASDKYRQRIGMWLRDEERMFYEVMPLAAKRAGMKDISWIDQASRKNFLKQLYAAGQNLSAEERTKLAPLFASWAARVYGEKLLAQFASGEQIAGPLGWMERAKDFARPVANRLYAGLRRG